MLLAPGFVRVATMKLAVPGKGNTLECRGTADMAHFMQGPLTTLVGNSAALRRQCQRLMRCSILISTPCRS